MAPSTSTDHTGAVVTFTRKAAHPATEPIASHHQRPPLIHRSMPRTISSERATALNSIRDAAPQASPNGANSNSTTAISAIRRPCHRSRSAVSTTAVAWNDSRPSSRIATVESMPSRIRSAPAACTNGNSIGTSELPPKTVSGLCSRSIPVSA